MFPEKTKAKLAKFVAEDIQPRIETFASSLNDDEIMTLLQELKTMKIDLRTDIVKEARSRNLVKEQKKNDPKDYTSPLDDLLGDGLL